MLLWFLLFNYVKLAFMGRTSMTVRTSMNDLNVCPNEIVSGIILKVRVTYLIYMWIYKVEYIRTIIIKSHGQLSSTGENICLLVTSIMWDSRYEWDFGGNEISHGEWWTVFVSYTGVVWKDAFITHYMNKNKYRTKSNEDTRRSSNRKIIL
jgi:hypothetical protein